MIQELTRYAQLSNNVVVNVIESETDPDGINGEWVACGDAGPGWTFDGAAFHAPEPEPVKRHISVGAFFDRFGAEKWAILASAAPGVQAIVKDASVRAYIDLDNPQLPMGLQILADAGHAIDAPAVINAAIEPGELP